MVMEVWRHVWAVGILVQHLGGDGRRGFRVGPALQVQVLYYGIDEVRLGQNNGSVVQSLDLDPQEITNFSLVINGEVLGTVA